MTPHQMADLHAACFTSPPPWSAGAFAAMLEGAGVFAICRPAGFVLARAVAGEAELLTLAVLPEARRRGLARALLAGFEAEACHRGAAVAFLEVAGNNAPARALYAATGYTQAGLRRAYYATAAGSPADALILRKPLTAG